MVAKEPLNDSDDSKHNIRTMVFVIYTEKEATGRMIKETGGLLHVYDYPYIKVSHASLGCHPNEK